MYNQIMKKNIFPNNGKINGVTPSPEMLNLLKKLLVVDQKYRINWMELINQDIFKSKPNLPERFRFSVNMNKLK